MQINITHTIDLPNPRRMELYRRNPDLGPRILFFSGGSALRKTSEELVYYTHNSIHVITPVDSGGSSAVLRDALQMPAIGDIRNRMMALADRGLTGKEVPPIEARVKTVFLSESRQQPAPTTLDIREKMKTQIRSADLICYPMGSFFSSLLSNILLGGVSDAIRRNPHPKVYIPNTGTDPELYGYSLADQVETLLEALKKDAPAPVNDTDVLNYILLDEKSGSYPGTLDRSDLERRGIKIINCRLVSMRSQPYIDEKMLVPVLLSLA